MKKTTIIEKNPGELHFSPQEGWAELKCSPFEIFINPGKKQIVERLWKYVDVFSYDDVGDFKKDVVMFFRMSGGNSICCKDIPEIFNEFCKLNLDHICK